jgi:hypothetical protein
MIDPDLSYVPQKKISKKKKKKKKKKKTMNFN